MLSWHLDLLTTETELDVANCKVHEAQMAEHVVVVTKSTQHKRIFQILIKDHWIGVLLPLDISFLFFFFFSSGTCWNMYEINQEWTCKRAVGNSSAIEIKIANILRICEQDFERYAPRVCCLNSERSLKRLLAKTKRRVRLATNFFFPHAFGSSLKITLFNYSQTLTKFWSVVYSKITGVESLLYVIAIGLE